MKINKIFNKKKRKGFSLVELLIYIAIFTATSVFMVGILIVFTQINLRQTAVNEVNNQISFVKNTIQRNVRNSSIINVNSGTTTSTLVLEMASSTLSPTTIYLEEDVIYLQEGSFSPIPLTDSNVVVDNFQVTKYENPGSYSLVQVNLTVSYNTLNEKSKFKRTINTAIGRVSAATFDSDMVPNINDSYNIGNASYKWQDAYFSGKVGIGTSPVTGISLKTISDISISDSSKGLILASPGGTCYRINVLNGGSVSSTVVACP